MCWRLDVRRLNLPLEVSYSTRNQVKTVRYLYTGIPSLYTKRTEPRVLTVEVFLLERVESSESSYLKIKLDCEQSVIFLLSHRRARAQRTREGRAVRNEGGSPSEEKIGASLRLNFSLLSTIICII